VTTGGTRAAAAAIAAAAVAKGVSESMLLAVAGGSSRSPRSQRASASRGESHRCSVASRPSTTASCPSGALARKKRASKRRGEISGVTQRTQGTSAATSTEDTRVGNSAPSPTARRAAGRSQPPANWP
jgi:hypothetical protein